MNVKRSITPGITIGDQPTEADLKALKDEGYVAVVNLRNDGEPEQPLSTSAERERAEALGLDYLHYGVGSAPLSEEGVSSVGRFLDEHTDGKTLVHCRKGGRAAALVLIYKAEAESWPPDEAVARGNALGLGVEGGLRQLVETYLRKRRPEAADAKPFSRSRWSGRVGRHVEGGAFQAGRGGSEGVPPIGGDAPSSVILKPWRRNLRCYSRHLNGLRCSTRPVL